MACPRRPIVGQLQCMQARSVMSCQVADGVATTCRRPGDNVMNRLHGVQRPEQGAKEALRGQWVSIQTNRVRVRRRQTRGTQGQWAGRPCAGPFAVRAARLLARNYRTPGRGGGEIDLGMREPDGTGGVLEVQQRQSSLGRRRGKHWRDQAAAHHVCCAPDAPGAQPLCRFGAVLEPGYPWIQGASTHSSVPARAAATECPKLITRSGYHHWPALTRRFMHQRPRRATHPAAIHRRRRPEVPGRPDLGSAHCRRRGPGAARLCDEGGGKVLVCGSGVSATRCAAVCHACCVALRARAPELAAVALNAPTVPCSRSAVVMPPSSLPGRCVRWGQTGDLLVVLSTSGNDPSAGRRTGSLGERDMSTVVALTGAAGRGFESEPLRETDVCICCAP